MAIIIGLSGGIASGKTTVANLFNEHFNIDIVDADIVAREVVAVGSDGLKQITDHFGEAILLEDGALNRSKLRELIFSDPTEKQWLNDLLHPMIRDKIDSDLSKVTSPYALLVAPLLVENQMQGMADRVLIVDVPTEVQIERTMSRDNVSKEQVAAILKSQASREQRLAVADDVIKNHTKNQELLPQITDLHQKYLAISTVDGSE
ncbi:dephospho-CoA kinase [Vibrio sp. 10N.247.311.14]|uniref:dephospho-CoA kinase n=1 Tax=unclassified Vibrio TaxID=2614977 RepID=UPI000C853B6B|nr:MULTISPECIES: dephospho-CoA kinase [unclassified Vibrio]PMK19846.1 dephospho-CoA kinase [Vibrio sp. 10N.261.54.C3]PMO00608.1 dephospho-CoA kinase [Vibrio sp. 10N.222.55.C12]PMO15053.1 dephospho-CoA kinase [Vibrio sp. 10N.222.54.F10]PMO18612.1 dephospho-CoA kinase [Vibrio sp. 10N.222.54.B6]TKF46834.1 dephospho-CoA kinase [Vibrio sp. F13]